MIGDAVHHRIAKETHDLTALPPLGGTCPMPLAIKLGLIHSLVDAACGAIVYAEVARGRLPYTTLVAMVLVYNSLAFGLQWLIGLCADLRVAYRLTGAAGVWLLALSVVLEPRFPWGGVIVAGIGNACFHVGAGAVVLQQSGGRATESGIFVAPGAIGVVAGMWLGLHAGLWCTLWVAMLLGSGLLLWRLIPRDVARPPARSQAVAVPWFPILAVLLLGTVAIRSAIGDLLGSTWSSPTTIRFALAGAIVAGQAVGGVLADRWGWRVASTVGLVVAAPLVTIGLRRVDALLTGMLIFQLTMPVTLAAIYRGLPKWPGLAFGLPCLALLIGLIPSFTGLVDYEGLKLFTMPIVLLSALFVFLGLRSCTSPGFPKQCAVLVSDSQQPVRQRQFRERIAGPTE